MHILQSSPVHPRLRRFVRAYAQREITRSDLDLVQPVPASLEHILEFEFREPPEIEYNDGTKESAYRIAVIGPHTEPVNILHLNGNIQSFAIFLQPLGLWQLFRVPVNELPDRAYKGDELLGRTIEELWQMLAECTSFEDKVATVERYLLKRAACYSGCTTTMNAATDIFRRQGICRIDEIARQSGLSVRHFERSFLGDIGIRPKLFARIARFQMALDLKLRTPHQTWLTIAHYFGYHDQMHMIRDFQSLSGAAPQRILADLGDTRPPALAGSNND